MTVEPQKLARIASAIQEQANLLRFRGCISQANGMERRATELRALCASAQSSRPAELQRLAA